MSPNFAARDFHYLHEIYLIAVGRLAGIFPDQQPVAVGQPLTGTVPTHEVVRPTFCTFREEVAQFAVATQHSVSLIIEDGDAV